MKYRSIPMLLTLLTLPQPALRGADSDRIDQRYYFRLTNTFLGDAYSLDTANDGVKGPMMAKSGDYSGQFWMFTRHDGVYRMTNLFLGPERSLDTYSDGENTPFMGQSGEHSGQRWRLTPVGGGNYRLTNDYLGEGRSLDTYSDGANAPFMGQSGEYSGQLWKLTKLRRI